MLSEKKAMMNRRGKYHISMPNGAEEYGGNHVALKGSVGGNWAQLGFT